LEPANNALAAYLSGEEVTDDTTAKDTTTATASADSPGAGADTASLASLLSSTDSAGAASDTGAASQQEMAKKNPLFAVWYPNVGQDGSVNEGPIVGIVRKQDTAKLNAYLKLDVV